MISNMSQILLSSFTAALVMGCGGASPSTQAANPCGAGNPCAHNPCGDMNPCGDNPCGDMNPCGDNPCGASNPCGGAAAGGASAVQEPSGWTANTGGLGDAALLAKGDALWNDKSLSKGGTMACQTCHGTDKMYKPSFAKAYPHEVAMAKKRLGLAQVSAAEMVQFCMVTPMKNAPLAWDSVELAALTRTVIERGNEFAKK